MKHRLSTSIRQHLPLILLFAVWGTFLVIIWKQLFFIDETGNLVAGWRIIWADWAMHLAQVNAFSSQPLLYVLSHHPLYAGIPLSYPFVINLLSAMLIKLGLGLVPALVWPSIILSLVMLTGLYVMGKTITRSGWQTFLGISLFLTSGGLGFYHFFVSLSQSTSLSSFLNPPQEYTRIDELGYYWYTTLVATVIPQRAFLLGIAVTPFLIGFLYRWYRTKVNTVNVLKIFFLGLTTGLLAWIHTHSLIIMFFVSFGLFIFKPKPLKPWIVYGLGTLLTAAPFFILLPAQQVQGFVKWYPGWLAHPSELNMPVVVFWLKNWGLMLPVFFVAAIRQRFEAAYRALLITFIGIFVLSNLFLFQPYSWDNSKLLLWVYLIFSLTVAGWLIQIWKKGWVQKIAVVSIMGILMLSGTLDLIRLTNLETQKVTMLSRDQIEFAAKVKRLTKPTDLILTADYHLDPVAVMSGRQIVMGYRGWLWSYGIEYSHRERDVIDIFRGAEDSEERVSALGIDYIVTSPKAREDLHANDAVLKQKYALIMTHGPYNVYKTGVN